MKFTLRNVAFAAAILAAGAVTAQEVPTVTLKFKTSEGITANVRAGNGFGGKVYLSDDTKIVTVDADGVKDFYTAEYGLNKGFAIDDAGNIMVNKWVSSASNWGDFLLIKADGSEATPIHINPPTESADWGQRSDVVGRAAGNFLSEEGGIFYLAASTFTVPVPVWLQNGEQVDTEYACMVEGFAAANTTAYALPRYLDMAEYDEESAANNFYYYTGSKVWDIGYVNEDGEAAFLPRPAEDQMPAEWAPKSQNGFEVFELGGQTYVVRMSGTLNWNSNFLIHDMEGNVIFHTDYQGAENNPAATPGYGCGVFARKVSDYKVELYQIFKGALDGSFVAMYEITIPEPVVPVTEFTVTEAWKSHINTNGGAVRGGNGVNGKVYYTNNTEIHVVDAEGDKVLYTAEYGLNKGFAIDDAGNIMVNKWVSSASNWGDFLLVKADGSEATPIHINPPTESADWGNRADLVGRAVGDFFSEEGGIFYLTANTFTVPVPVWLQNGEQVDTEYACMVEGFAAANTTAYALPRYLDMAEYDEESAANNFYYYTGSKVWDIGYVNEDGEVAYLPEPAEDQMPAGWAKQTQNGFDVLELGGKTYIIRMSGQGTWNANFLINDMEGNVVFHTDYPEDWNNTVPGTTGNGCGIFARKISETEAEIYQVFVAGGAVANNSFVAVYNVKVPGEIVPPEPEYHYYITGDFNGWDPANPAEFTVEEGLYTFNYTQHNGGSFKLSTSKGTWDEFNAGAFSVEGAKFTNGMEAQMVPWGENSTIADGEWTFMINPYDNVIMVWGTPDPFKAPELYLRGEFNQWGTTAMTTNGEVNDEGYVLYTWSGEELNGEFKVANDSWSQSWGTATIEGAGTFELTPNGENMKAMNLYKPTLTFKLPAIDQLNPVLEVAVEEPEVPATKAEYAYGIKVVENGNNYDVTFNSTGEAVSAAVILTDKADATKVVRVEGAAVVKGENTISVNALTLDGGEYSVAVEIVSNPIEKSGLVLEKKYDLIKRGGVVTINDTESDAFGYTAFTIGGSNGVYTIAPDGTEAGPFFVNDPRLGGTNQSSMFRGAERDGKAVFADWSDGGAGLWVFDPLKTDELTQLFGGEKDKAGYYRVGDVIVGGGTTCASFYGEGEDQILLTYIEDYEPTNTMIRYNVGTAQTIDFAPVAVYDNAKKLLPNTNVDVIATKDGFFASQVRSEGQNLTGVPAFGYLTYDDEVLFQSSDIPEITSGNSAIALANDGVHFAAGEFTAINYMTLAWNEYGEPEFTVVDEIPVDNIQWANFKFDYAGNLHAWQRETGSYAVYAFANEAPTCVVPAKAEYTVTSKNNGVENITIGNDEEEAVYYNLQGVRVENPANGVYIRRVGNTATKVFVK